MDSRSDAIPSNARQILRWLGVEELLEKVSKLPPNKEFDVLLLFLDEFAGGREIAEHRMAETLVDQAAESYSAYTAAVRMIENRLKTLYLQRNK